jgi:osmotically inducible protein OsmC
LAREGEVGGIDAEEFQRHAESAKSGCPVSKALAGVEISLEAHLLADSGERVRTG